MTGHEADACIIEIKTDADSTLIPAQTLQTGLLSALQSDYTPSMVKHLFCRALDISDARGEFSSDDHDEGSPDKLNVSTSRSSHPVLHTCSER